MQVELPNETGRALRHIRRLGQDAVLLRRYLDGTRAVQVRLGHLRREACSQDAAGVAALEADAEGLWQAHVAASWEVAAAVARARDSSRHVRAWAAQRAGGEKGERFGRIDAKRLGELGAPGPARAAVLGWLESAGIPLRDLATELGGPDGVFDLDRADTDPTRLARLAEHIVRDVVARAVTLEEKEEASGVGGARQALHDDTAHDPILPFETEGWDPELFDGASPGAVFETYWASVLIVSGIGLVGGPAGSLLLVIAVTFMFIVLLIVWAVVELLELIADALNDTDDDRARSVIARSTCEELASLDAATVDSLITSLLDGPTGNDDERAIIKLLECLPAERVATEVWPRHGRGIMADTNGDEFDRLMAVAFRKGVVDPSRMDDDATRDFIAITTCEQLGRLDLAHVQRLVRNLFSGSTGDDDERAINRLVGCQSCDRIERLLSLRGTRYGDFDYKMQGDEWRAFRRILAGCGLPR